MTLSGRRMLPVASPWVGEGRKPAGMLPRSFL
jgi:hypothetical protein